MTPQPDWLDLGLPSPPPNGDSSVPQKLDYALQVLFLERAESQEAREDRQTIKRQLAELNSTGCGRFEEHRKDLKKAVVIGVLAGLVLAGGGAGAVGAIPKLLALIGL